jgi:hypothetical protein
VDRIPRWRVALVASALVVLGALGAGLVLAADPATPPAAPEAIGLGAFLDPGPPPGDAAPITAERLGHRAGRLLHRMQRLVHVEATVDLPDKGIVTFAVDHGTISAIGGDSISVKEKDGRTVTLKTTDETRVRKDREPAKLTDLKVGDEVVVMSRLESGSFVAYRIGVPPAQPAEGATN